MRVPPFVCSALVLLTGALATAADIDFSSSHSITTSGPGAGSVAVGRLDNNSSNDLVIGYEFSGTISVLLNDGTGTFGSRTELPVPGSSHAVAIIDLNGDGKNDVVVANDGGISVYLGNGDGTFHARTGFTTISTLHALRVVDVDADGKLDVIAGGVGLDFFKGDGAGGFAPVQHIMTTGLTDSLSVGDLNGDGKIDIACANQNMLTTLLGHGDGTFAAPITHGTTLGDARAVVLGDLTGHGLDDLTASSYAGPTDQILVRLNLGGGALGPATSFITGGWTKCLQIVDVDGDGLVDLVCNNAVSSSVGILRGHGDGTFHPHIGYLTAEAPFAVAVADLDGNGSVDLATANFGSRPVSVLLQGVGTTPGMVTIVDASPVTDQGALLAWTTPMVESHGPATHYDLRIAPGDATSYDFATATPVLPGPEVGTGGSAATFLLSGLSPASTYSVAFTATDAFARTSPLSVITTFTTTAGDVTPPSQPTFDLSWTGEDYCVLSWLAPGDDGMVGTAIGYDLRMSTTPITDAITFAAAIPISIPPPAAGGQREQITVSGLLRNTTYYFALTVHDEVPLISSRSPTLQVTTAAGDTTPPTAVSDLSVVSSSATSLTVAWTASGDDGGTGSATSYDLRWSTTPITDGASFLAATHVDGIPSPAAAGTMETVVISGLIGDTHYYVALRIADEVPNESPLSNILSTTTADGIPPAAVSDLSVVSSSATSLTVAWTASGDDGGTGSATSYDLRWSTTPITDGAGFLAATPVGGIPNPATAGTMETVVISGLTSDTRYYVALRIADEVPNESPLSNILSTTTADGIPPAAITDLAITVVTATALTLTWTAPGDNGHTGDASSYEIRYSTTPISAANFTTATPVIGAPWPHSAGTTESMTLTGLGAGTTYHVAIRTRDEVPNTSDVSNVASGTTISTVSVPEATNPGTKCGFGSGLAAFLLLCGWGLGARTRNR